VIGIPFAVVGILTGVFAAYAGICGVPAALGAALVRHKSVNPYVHLAVGCLVYLVLGAIPWVGWVGGVVTASTHRSMRVASESQPRRRPRALAAQAGFLLVRLPASGRRWRIGPCAPW
jgi:hypothetical protein